MAALGFTINTLSMFGLVLAIGLLVDDAIVVVENVERVMEEEGSRRSRRPARPWGSSPAPSSALAMVISAVFVPVAFSSGTVGAIYREFSLTIVAAMLLSVFVALTLTPALCATILRPPRGATRQERLFRLVQSPASTAAATSTSAECGTLSGASGAGSRSTPW